MSDASLFDSEAVDLALEDLTPELQSAPVPAELDLSPILASKKSQSVSAPLAVQPSPSSLRRSRWFKDEAPKLEEWLVYPTYLEVAAELDARHLPGVYIHGSKTVVKGRDPNGKLRSMKVPDISFVESAAVQRLLTTIYSRVRQEQIVVTGGRYLTEEQFNALSESTYKALTAAGTSSLPKGRRSVGPRTGRKVSPSMAVKKQTDKG